MLRLRGMRNSQDGSLAKPGGNQVVGNEENKFRAPRPAHRDMNRTPLYPVKDNHRRSTRKRPLNTKDASVSKIVNGRLVEVFEDSIEKPIERYAARKDTFEPPTKVTRAKAKQHDIHQHDNTIVISNNPSVGLETTRSKSALDSPSRHQPSSNGTIGSLFQTGRGQNVKVSEAKVQAYEKMLHNDFRETSISENIEKKTSIQSLFSNGRGNAITISAKTLKYYEDIVHNYDNYNEDEQSSLVMSHFQTGSGKNVKVSAGNLQKYKETIAFENYESDENEEPLSSVTSLFQTGSGKSVQISASKLKKYEVQYAADNDEVLQIDSNDTRMLSASVTSLFQTGSGKSVQISALNLQKYTEQIASDDSTSDILSGNFRPINNVEEHRLPAVDEEHISHLVKNGVDGTEDDGESYPRHPKATKTTSELNINTMFQTGLGRTVKVSAKKAQLYDQILFSSNDRQSEEVDTSVKNIPHAVCDQRIQDDFIDEAKQLFFDKPGALNVGYDTNRSNFNSVANGQEGLNSHIHEKDFSQMSKVQSPRPIETSKSLIESASGEMPSIYSDKAKEYQAKLLKSPTADRFPSNDFLGQNSAMTESLFQTGSGRSVQVSAHLVHLYQEKFARDKPMGEFYENPAAKNSLELIPKPNAIAGFVQSEDTIEHNAQMQTSAIETSSFQSCRGQDIRTSTAAFKKYEVKFQSQKQTNLLDENAARSHDTESTRLNFGEQGQSAVSEEGDNTSKFGHMAKISPVKGEKDAADEYYVHDLGSSSSGVVQSLFQTAGGSDVMVSTEKLRMYDMKLQSDNFDEANAQIPSQVHGILDTNSSEGDYTILFEKTSSEELVNMAVPVNEYHQIEQGGQTLEVNEHKTTYPTSNELDNINTSNVELPTAKQTFSARIRDRRTFQPPRPRKQGSSPVVPGKVISKPIISVSNKFPIHVYEKWSFSALASCPDAFNKYPFESPIMDITAENAHLVRFDYLGKPNLDSHDGNVGALDLYNYMVSLNFLNPAIGATFRWFINHFRWVILKCASMERAFVSQLFGKYCAQAQIAYQLNRRCHLELENSQRPILKRVYQKDVHAGNAMVLFVAAVYETHWVLSDGWYGMVAVPDDYLKKHGNNLGGTKLVVWNSTMQNNAEGLHPLEAPINQADEGQHLSQFDREKDPYIVLHTNSTRRVNWRTKLGEECNQFFLRSLPLKSLKQNGGLVRSIRCVILRSSGLLYLQPKENTQGPRVLSDIVMEKYHAEKTTSCVPFMRLKIACTHGLASRASNHSSVAVMTIWRPNEETQIICKEGMEIFATSLVVSWKLRELSLSSSKHSTFAPLETSSLPEAHSFVGYERRSCLRVSDVQETLGQEVDICVYLVLVTNEFAFATDQSLKLLSIKLPHYGIKDWKMDSVLCIRNLFVSHFDERLGILDCSMTDSSSVIKSPTKNSYFFEAHDALKTVMATKAASLDTLVDYITSSILHVTKSNSPQAESDDVIVLVGHPMHIYPLPSPGLDNAVAILYIDEGSQSIEVLLTSSLMAQVKEMLPTTTWTQVIRVEARVICDDAMTNSCRSWEAFGSCRLVATKIGAIATSDHIQALLKNLN